MVGIIRGLLTRHGFQRLGVPCLGALTIKKDPILWGCCCASETYILGIRPMSQVGIDEKGVSEHKGYLMLRS